MSLATVSRYLDFIKARSEEFVAGDIEIITDKQTMLEFEKEHQCDLGFLYESPYHILLKDLVRSENRIFAYERILKQHTGNAVVVIPIYEDNFVLLKQFRHSMRDFQLCFPRGFGEPDISTAENACKEISEELGCSVISCEIIGKTVADSGMCGEKVSICLCRITKPVLKFDYEGIKNIELVSFSELTELIRQDKINDGFTLSAFGLYMAKNK